MLMNANPTEFLVRTTDFLVRVTAELPLFAVMGNTDNNEGCGAEFPLVFCYLESTAQRLAKGRYVQGSDCPVEKVTARFIDGKWYFPGARIEHGSDADRRREDELARKREAAERKEAALKKAFEAGLSLEDIDALRG